MDIILTIATDILLIAWAICVLLLVAILWHLLWIVIKAKAFVVNTQNTYNQIMTYVLEPIKYLSTRLMTRDEEDEEDEDELPKPKKKKKK